MSNQSLINFLNQELSNIAVMYIKLHRYHWFIKGKHFFTLHTFFEELYTEMAEDLDVLAERILAIGGKPLATMAKFLDEASLAEAQADDEEKEIFSVLIEDYTQMIKEMKETGFGLAEEANDQPTIDLFNDLQGRYEKHLWMFRAYLAKE
ncbi:Dps family protein [Heyndrickxia acidicola]|uniref:DNA starvation/stationary phase protection protein n=1 Tax=Heyndrickxia acidicola TaxID=209389 RepID=A0ABU6MBU8_9BACI|nr:DNA starvation/stationary phase protection protein [Heyndrickxia acidicola]MED1201749.1 DNA starvation/stationary phase protection protein [Heyndrickxia acidicola]